MAEMGNTDKGLALALVLVMAILSASLLMVKPANGELPISTPPISTSSAPIFSLKFVDNSYYVQPTTTSTTDPYTGNVTTTTKAGYLVENKTIQAVIANNLEASYYNFRFKGHYSDQWSYFPSDPNIFDGYNHMDSYSVPCQADSSSSYTTIALTFLPSNVPVNGQLDVQVQALFGGYRAVPYGHFVPLPAPTYDFYFNGTVSSWSNSQTLVYNGTDYILPANSSPSASSLIQTPSPAVPEFPSWILLLVTIIVVLTGLVYFKKTQSQIKVKIS
jgi:hypothetical protein